MRSFSFILPNCKGEEHNRCEASESVERAAVGPGCYRQPTAHKKQNLRNYSRCLFHKSCSDVYIRR